MRLVAMKRLRYPRGVDGKEYNPGDEFEALSDRDAKALTLVRAAKEATEAKPVAATVPKRTRVTKPAPEPDPDPVEPMTTDQEPRRYMRRDLISED